MKDLKSKLTNVRESFKSCGCCRVFCLNAEPNVKSVKMPLSKLIFKPFGIMVDKLSLLFRLSAVFALLLTVLSSLTGFNFLCFGNYREEFLFCSDSNSLYIVYFFIKMFVISIFFGRWYTLAFSNGLWSWKTLLRPERKDLCATGILVLFLVLNMIPVLSLYMLYVRVPNPDWVIETAYFAVVSLGFLVPFVLMRFYSMFAFFLDGQKSPSLGIVWTRSSGNNLGIILSLFLILISMTFIFVNLQRGFTGVETYYVTYVGIVSEFFYNLLFLMCMTLLVNNAYVQKELLFGDNKNEKSAAN